MLLGLLVSDVVPYDIVGPLVDASYNANQVLANNADTEEEQPANEQYRDHYGSPTHNGDRVKKFAEDKIQSHEKGKEGNDQPDVPDYPEQK